MSALLDTDLLKTFIVIADTGSFTRAAAEVGRTQSAVSMQVRRLEEILGRPLFAREGRQSRLTADGEKLIEYARRIVRLHDEAVSSFDAKAINGIVRFGTPDEYADRFLPEALSRFAAAHPQVQIDVECLTSDRLLPMVRRGELDLALITICSDSQDAEIVRHEPLVWVTSARHEVHLHPTVPLALAHPGCDWRRAALTSLEAANRPHRIAFASDNSNAINAAVLAGIAVAVLPAAIVRPGMRVLDDRDDFPPLGASPIGLVRKPGKPTVATDALARHIAAAMPLIGAPAREAA